MKHLIKNGLYGGGLVAIKSPRAVSMYNECLHAIGRDPTKLTQFNIDGRGWSPEIAEEMGEMYYLANGDANPYAVIITPRQQGLPVYYPHHSFDRDLLASFFDIAGRHVDDLTGDTGIWLDLDQYSDAYMTPDDLQMIDSVVIRASTTGDLIDAAREQRKLVHEIQADRNWMNQDLRRRLQESGRKHGDLRFRSLVIEDIPYTKVRSFYAIAFGGTYVFRDCLSTSRSLIILENPDEKFLGPKDVLCVCDQMSVLERLREEGLLECALARFSAKPDILKRIRSTMLDNAICDAEAENEEFNVSSLTTAQRDAYAQRLREKLPDTYREIQALTRKVETGTAVQIEDLSKELQMLLLRPSVDPTKDPMLYDLIMRLVVTLGTVPLELMYAFNKPYFFSQYMKWSLPKKLRAIECINNNRLKRAQKNTH